MLAGCRVLVVEDEALVAEEIAHLLAGAGSVPIGPVSGVNEARQLIRQTAALDAALLDMNLRDGPVTPVLEALSARHVPTVVYTGGIVPEDVRRRHPDLIVLSKPVLPARLMAELRRVIGKPCRP